MSKSIRLAQDLGFSASEVLATSPIEKEEEKETISEVAISTQEIVEACKSSLDFLAALAMPAIYMYVFPPTFQAVWQWLLTYIHKKRDFSQLALGLPRGFGKTILMKVFILYCILFTDRKFFLIMCSSQTKANNVLSDIVDMLEENNIKRVFGDWRVGCEVDRQDLKKFGYRGRNIIIMAAGADTDVRGITLKNERPDVMLFDDVQSRQCAESQIQSETLERELVGTVMKAKSPHGCLYIFVGNMYPTKWSILRKLKTNPNWIKFIAGGILYNQQTGTQESLWEELQPLAQLNREFQNDLAMGRPDVFYSEVLNDENASSNNLINLSKLPSYDFLDQEIAGAKFVIIDPATGKLGGDSVAIGYFEVYNGTPVLRHLTNERLSPGETIRKSLEYCLRYGANLVAIESVAYQSTLAYWFQHTCNQMGIIGIEAVEIYPGGLSKNSRILDMLKSYMKGDMYVHPSCQPTVHLQITQFNPIKKDNVDDVLDLLWYAPKVIEMYGAYLASSTVLATEEYSELEVWENNSGF